MVTVHTLAANTTKDMHFFLVLITLAAQASILGATVSSRDISLDIDQLVESVHDLSTVIEAYPASGDIAQARFRPRIQSALVVIDSELKQATATITNLTLPINNTTSSQCVLGNNTSVNATSQFLEAITSTAPGFTNILDILASRVAPSNFVDVASMNKQISGLWNDFDMFWKTYFQVVPAREISSYLNFTRIIDAKFSDTVATISSLCTAQNIAC